MKPARRHTLLVLALACAALAGSAVAQSDGEWEYLVVAYGAPSFAAPLGDLSVEEASYSKVLRFAELGVPLPSEAADLQRDIDLLGRFGWELVTVVAGAADQQWIFKRPYDAERSDREADRITAERIELLAAHGASREPPRVADPNAPPLVDLDAVERVEATAARNERNAATVGARIAAAAERGFPLSDLTVDARALAPDGPADVRVRVAQDVTAAALVGENAYRRSLAIGAHEAFLEALASEGLVASAFAFCSADEGGRDDRVQLVVDLVVRVGEAPTIVATRRSTHCFDAP